MGFRPAILLVTVVMVIAIFGSMALTPEETLAPETRGLTFIYVVFLLILFFVNGDDDSE